MLSHFIPVPVFVFVSVSLFVFVSVDTVSAAMQHLFDHLSCHVAPFLLTIAHSSRVYSILSEVDGFSFHFFLCSRFKILFSRLKTLFASMLSATAYIAPAALSQNLFDNLRQIIFRNNFCNFTNRFSHSNKYI